MSSVKEKYGYLLGLKDDNFEIINRKPNLTFEIPKSGYNFGATDFVCRKTAEMTENCAFLSTIALWNAKDEDAAFDMKVEAIGGAAKTMVGEVPIVVNAPGCNFDLLDDIAVFTREVAALDEDINNHRVVIPITMNSAGKEAHGIALCIDIDRERKHADIIMLEQHAMRDGGKLDYSAEVDKTLSHLKNIFEKDGAFEAEIFQNEKPICREKGVCGIVSAEVCRRLLNAQNPMSLAKSGAVKITEEKVKALHAANFKAYLEENPPLPLIMKNNGFSY